RRIVPGPAVVVGEAPVLGRQDAPVPVRLARDVGLVGAAIAEAEAAQPVRGLEVVGRVAAPGQGLRLVVLDVVHREAPVIVLGPVQIAAGDVDAGNAAADVDDRLERIGAQHRALSAHGEAEDVRGGLHVLNVARDVPGAAGV